MMCGTIVPHDTGTIQDKTNRQVLSSHIVYHLIVSTLQEGRINATERFQTFGCHTCGHGYGMLFGNTHIIGTLGETSTENVHSRSTRHSSCDTDNSPIFGGLVNEGIGKNRCQTRCQSFALDLNTRSQIKLGNTVHLITGLHSRGVSVSLDGLQVKQDWLTAITVAKLFENGNQVIQIMSIDGSDIVKSKFFKKCTTRGKATCIFINTFVDALNVFRQKFVETLGKVTEILEWFGYQKSGGVFGKLRCGNRTTGTGCSRR
mmetsp:Transcript_17429/g.24221  ORF Transcript_17429/g.24221 Transcript_17429/m.24221 type:complete len:260 (-) Transcript_17429:715-1494(-)